MRILSGPERFIAVAFAALAVLQHVGCGGAEEAPAVQVDEVREKALTDSMRGYFDNENKKETRKEVKNQPKSESNP